jgi:multisubunit Na+/H+ antiporter MnhB subunit
MQASLALQNLSIFGASIALLVLLMEPWPAVNKSFKLFSGLVLIVNVFGGISALASLATKVSLERDW